MDPNNTPYTSGYPSETNAPQPLMPEPHKQKPGLSTWIIAVIFAVFVVLIGVIIVLSVAVAKKNAADHAVSSSPGEQLVNATKQVVATKTTKNENIDFLLYTPRQTANNTTIDFALKNTCDQNCPVKSYAQEQYASSHAGKDLTNMYLIDESAAEKYMVVTDTRDKSLVSPECFGYLKPGQKIDCFISFAKVPSGSTVSLVMRDFRIDNILIP